MSTLPQARTTSQFGGEERKNAVEIINIPQSNVIKVVLVGDTSVGKSCLITNYLHNTFTEEYEPTVLDVYKGTKAVNS